MKRLRTLLTALLLPTAATARFGLVGYGQWWYDPPCGYACRNVFGAAPLNCTTNTDSTAGEHTPEPEARPRCIAHNDNFLQTLAYCLGTRCVADGVSAARLETFWAEHATGDPAVLADRTYGAVLAGITSPPTRVYKSGDTLNYTALIADEDYQYQASWNRFYDWQEAVHSTYIIIIFSIGLASPLLFSCISNLRLTHGAIDAIRPYLLQPSSIPGGYNVRPLPYLLGNAPTMGQSLWIAMFMFLNIVLGLITYRNFDQAHPWRFDKTAEILAYMGNRTGHISFALLPLTILFSSRNNFLLWLTDWPFSTFLVLHRWVARICAAHAVVHSMTLLAAYTSTGYAYTAVYTPYWIWGIVGTVSMVFMLVQSIVWLRRTSYEIFLILHISLAILVLVACWYHIRYWIGITGLYELWLYMVFAVWAFDRLARWFRVAQNGLRRATVVELSADIVRLDIPGVRWTASPGRHAYVHFPTLHPLRVWENHPFSVTETALLHPQKRGPLDSADALSSKGDEEMLTTMTTTTTTKTTATGKEPRAAGAGCISIYVKKHRGATALLRERAAGLPVLLDGPYRGGPPRRILRCNRVLLIGGGIGITGLLTWAHAHVNVKLAWSLRETSRALLEDLEPALDGLADKVVVVGRRLDVDALLMREVQAGWKRVGVVVCGPPGLCDHTRTAVVRAGKKTTGTVFELEVDAFTW
ncbi:uncharacterized protein PpBr36_09920 [Pyricularia pennisetigena]|uniref:uncharacterized protein n=1 Tax=Pyricularia pennisetigena TaxID=1578925 RepID=UPI00114E3BF6|nr:uncharacterized protein PpBr36_09920 [Pyricularia pennisetigena]TLS22377.1 hypothetical protein PpBr36_09920 [Pyricularia pennisetigena]